ncbi:outer membrane protein TolC [Larkinella arboricola]|uniref:Outer membrane protein TolC n=1 Tax=Larkinella arboricola TaxID=643671 RepID=A0A327WLJ1_LARAB|nr:TolC family protein [Larkinella arboricola]RAJ92625.1 outer membrane protein TolC [Larkinella arboricola]
MKKYLIAWLLSLGPLLSYSQQAADSTLRQATLESCIQYALQHQPVIKQSELDKLIAERTIRSALSNWLPQISGAYNIQHYLKLPISLLPNFSNPSSPERVPVTTGLANLSNIQFTLNQNIFNRDALLASRTADTYRRQASQSLVDNQIDVTVNVSKAFYDLILTQKQVDILDSDILRLERSLQDATNQYKSGIVDRTDYKRAAIALNNSRAQRKQAQEQINGKAQYLKQLMGYPPKAELQLTYDTLQLANEIYIDTTQLIRPENRIEFQLLQTQQDLLKANLQYNRWAYLPSVSALANYNFVFQNNEFARLYSRNFPNSLVGLSIALPIFQGGRRVQETRIAELRLERSRWDLTNLTNAVNTEYQQALANYKGNLANYRALQENLDLATDVYRVIQLQYRSGVRTYLDVIIAQNDLRATQLTYFNALYQVLVSKLDVQRALGTVPTY